MKRYPLQVVKDNSYVGFCGNGDYEKGMKEGMVQSELSSINSVKQYDTNDKEVFVLNIQCKQTKGEQKKSSLHVKDIQSAAFEEPVSYHEHGFDLFIVRIIKKKLKYKED